MVPTDGPNSENLRETVCAPLPPLRSSPSLPSPLLFPPPGPSLLRADAESGQVKRERKRTRQAEKQLESAAAEIEQLKQKLVRVSVSFFFFLSASYPSVRVCRFLYIVDMWTKTSRVYV